MKTGLANLRVGDSLDTYLLVKSATRGLTQVGKPFLTLFLQDKTADIEAKLWDVTKEDEAKYIPRKIVKVSGEIMDYRGRRQLKIKSIRVATKSDPARIDDLLETAPLTQEVMFEKITNYIFEMNNPNIQRITRYLVRKHQDAFLRYPAATKNHHEFVSGLAYHVVSMLKLAEAVAKQYPSLNTDLLYAGVILHDLGKVHELSGSVAATYTTKGLLLGHISIMVSEIEQAAHELEIEGEEIVILQHLVLSHHGKAEWGSPKPPLIREAEILHLIDNLDAKMNMLDRALTKIERGEYTERIFPLDNRSFYKPTFD